MSKGAPSWTSLWWEKSKKRATQNSAHIGDLNLPKGVWKVVVMNWPRWDKLLLLKFVNIQSPFSKRTDRAFHLWRQSDSSPGRRTFNITIQITDSVTWKGSRKKSTQPSAWVMLTKENFDLTKPRIESKKLMKLKLKEIFPLEIN